MSRNQGVDFFRVVAIIAIISIHTSPFAGMDGSIYYQNLNMMFNQSARFAIPFFFIVSGYFWGVKVVDRQKLLHVSQKMIQRLFIIFMFWCSVYLLPYSPESFGEIEYVHSKIVDIINNPVSALLTGTRVHLWFLVSLGLVVFATSFFAYFRAIKTLIIFSILLYILGLATWAYAETPLGLNLDIKTLIGPFRSTIFFVTGFFLSKIQLNQSYLKYGFVVMIIGYILHFSEAWYLYTTYDIKPNHDYLIGTYFMGLGVALMALSDHYIFHIKYLTIMGKYVLGIYVIHMLFVDIFKNIDLQYNSPLWEVGYIFMILFLSFTSTYILSRFKIMKKVLM